MREFFRADSILRVQTLTRAGLEWGHRNILLYPCIVSVRNWIGNYCYFSEATTCIRGYSSLLNLLKYEYGLNTLSYVLFFSIKSSGSFVNHALVNILITYLNDNWSTPHFEMAALVTNVQEGVSGIMVIVLAHISGTHMARFKTIASTNAAFFLFMSTHTEAKVYYGAAPLIVLGEAGRSATLQEFLEDQYFSEQKERTSTEENYLKRLETRKEALWPHPWFLGALLAVLLPTGSWKTTFMISAILVGVASFVFLYGYSCYFGIDAHEIGDVDAPEQEINEDDEEEDAPEQEINEDAKEEDNNLS
ncbi:unnamed protein product [Prunus armeniaca]|uniref:Uncharacterized protein n=1 Tax=Prunus armeniaca TaxID=36596 RepID=A0A6J5TI68_PRUAR|nr:unnamed protein product [Prunus armeniaca]